ncbi:MAG: radical SAM protein [Acidobacteriota bacterium]|nr:radical SAM protein [Acidobacteriota bacterium]
MRPGYLAAIEHGGFEEKLAGLKALLSPCRLCPRECGVDRLSGEAGFCGGLDRAVVSGSGPHFGEERPLVGSGGSGTIFFAGCNLGCVFCQNYDISHLRRGRPMSCAALAQVMLDLQEQGCHNINFVTPTHFAPQLVEAVGIAARQGLRLPLVWNCGGYESAEALRLLDGIVDIYMPDAKYWDAAVGRELSGVPDYPQRMREAITEMHRQVGDLVLDRRGVATRGLLVRHLVLPENLAGTAGVAGFLASLSRDTYVNIMAQYRPCHRASEFPRIARRITSREFCQAMTDATSAGLHRFDERPTHLAWP